MTDGERIEYLEEKILILMGRVEDLEEKMYVPEQIEHEDTDTAADRKVPVKYLTALQRMRRRFKASNQMIKPLYKGTCLHILDAERYISGNVFDREQMVVEGYIYPTDCESLMRDFMIIKEYEVLVDNPHTEF